MTRKINILVLLLLLSACGDTSIKKQVEDLDYAIDSYAYALRWARTNDAVAYHMNRDGSRPTIDTSAMALLRVTGFTIMEKTLNADFTGASVKSEYSYYFNDSATLRTIEHSQSWWYEPEAKKWYVDSEFPQFK